MCARKVKSQWDFGELFPPPETRRVLTVGQLTRDVRASLERQFESLWVSGEISNLRAQASGHIYFTLKDADAQLACVLFRGERGARRDLLADGRRVVLGGALTVYEPRGQYQLRVTTVEAQGEGALQAAFEALKRKLQAEGLFDPARKRPLPRFPRRIGVVTSPTGAALRDVLHVIRRRDPGLEVVLAPCRVQGDGAAAEIAAAIALLNEWSTREQAMAPERGIDLVLVTRGGGSLEDLWAFNEESVARAVVASALPVVSAVGHEIDFTICDFAADLRAATPSAAAEIVTADIVACRPFLEDLPDRLRLQATRRLDRLRDEWRALSRHLQLLHPRRRLDDRAQRLDDLGDRRRRALAVQIERRRSRLEALEVRMRARRPEAVLVRRREQWQSMRTRLVERARAHLERIRHRVDEAAARAELLSPAKVLGRGYSITREAGSGRLLRNATEVQPGAELVTRLAEGELRSRVL